jgi:poly(glycerol-phosphate) alpha-glucosyltransferase
MLDPWATKNSRWKKQISHLFIEGSHFRNAACIRALGESEKNAIRTYGLKNPVCIIPNGVDLVDAEMLTAKTLKSERKILLFLGRLHPKKGLVNALRAWKEVLHSASNIQHSKFHEWQFVIAGWDQGGHEAELKRLCDDRRLTYTEMPAASFLSENCKLKTENSQIVFVGPAFGPEKEALLRSASAFILPSFSEGLPMSVLEAWSYQLPVLMTEHCNLPEGFAAGAALRIGTDVASISEGLRELFALPATDNGQPTTSLASIGRNGRALVERQFTWPQVAAQMKEVYEWVLGGGSKPGCVEK